MNSLVQSFQIDSAALFGLLSRYDAFIAGGAALHTFLDGTPAEFTGDIDIWFPNVIQRDGPTTVKDVNRFIYAMTDFTNFFKSQGYYKCGDASIDKARYKSGADCIKEMDSESIAYHRSNSSLHKIIRKILTFTKGTLKIQVIFAYKDKQSILKSFDYSFCSVAYDHKTESYDGIYLDMTRDKKGVLLNEPSIEKRGAERLKKYQDRGFTLFTA